MSLSSLDHLLEKQQSHFHSGSTLSLEGRREALRSLLNALQKGEGDILQALHADLAKSTFEAYTNEIGILYLEIRHILKHLSRWMKPVRKRVELHLMPGRGRIHFEPYGNSLIIGPWNYPFQLVMAPLAAALAAGNTAILKPSEMAPHTANIVEKLIRDTFDEELVSVVQGGIPETTRLLDLPFDKIFFTGSVPVGRIVMKAAARRLTPLTLELGGKSPAIVDDSARLRQAARRIAWAKFNNAGQTCVAPDYLLVHQAVMDEFLGELKKTLRDFYGEDPSQSPEYGRIINAGHLERIAAMIEREKVFYGGKVDRKELYISPTILTGGSLSDPVMKEEIFGPLLPVLPFGDIPEALEIIRTFPKPLSLYIFSRSRKTRKDVIQRASFGGGGINTALLHVASSRLPFGGVGPSGMGRYHGRAGFLEFSNAKSLLQQPSFFDPGIAYPGHHLPLKWIRRILK